MSYSAFFARCHVCSANVAIDGHDTLRAHNTQDESGDELDDECVASNMTAENEIVAETLYREDFY